MNPGNTNKLVIGLAIMLGIVVFTNNVLAKTYRWVDKDGKVHYSQSIPPSDSQYGHEELDTKNGFIVNEVASSEELKKRQKEEQLKNERDKLAKQALREELMIYMFSSKSELKQHFEERLKMISNNIRLLQFHKKILKKDIEKAQKNLEKAGSGKLKAKLTASLEESQRSLIDHARAIESNEKERAEVSSQMTRAIINYDKKFGGSDEVGAGSLVGENVLSELRNNMKRSSTGPGACSCPCTTSAKSE